METEKLLAVMNVFEQIKNTSAKNGKIGIIKSNKGLPLFKDFLVFLFDDFITTGISSKKIHKEIKPKDDSLLSDYLKPRLGDIKDVFKYLDGNTGSDEAIKAIQNYINAQDFQLEDFLTEVLSKSYKCGITAKSINKAWGETLIEQFGCQLAHSFNKYPDRVKEFYLTQKLDGHRCICIIRDGEPKFYTRKGIEIPNLIELEFSARQLMEGHSIDYVLDGELLIANAGDMEAKEAFKRTSKILKKKDGNKVGIVYNVFDILPLDEYLIGDGFETYTQRRNLLEDIVPDKIGFIHKVPVLYHGTDKSMIATLQKKLVEPNGWEGLMLNDATATYQTKRTPGLLKIKKFFNADIEVVDVYEGTGENEGKLGGVVAKFKDFLVQVGSGFSEDDRINFWNDPSKIIHHIIDVQYFEETTNQKGGKGLRFPTFKSLRDDKTLADVSYES
jgi:DNA ligase-1